MRKRVYDIEERATIALLIAIKPVVWCCVYSQAEQLAGFMSELHVHRWHGVFLRVCLASIFPIFIALISFLKLAFTPKNPIQKFEVQ